MTASTERVAYLLWQVNEGYLTAEDRAVGTNWFTEPIEDQHPDDQAERPHWMALAEEVIAEVRRLDSGSERHAAACGHIVTDRQDLHWSDDLEDEVCPDCCEKCK